MLATRPGRSFDDECGSVAERAGEVDVAAAGGQLRSVGANLRGGVRQRAVEIGGCESVTVSEGAQRGASYAGAAIVESSTCAALGAAEAAECHGESAPQRVAVGLAPAGGQRQDEPVPEIEDPRARIIR